VLDRIIDRLGTDRTSEALARVVGSMISNGELETGAKLPTVRALATALDVSPNTVTEAWRILRLHGVIETNRRLGTTVRAPRRADGRHWQVPVEPGTIELDLSTGTPDKELLPPLGPVLEGLHHSIPVTSYVDPPVLAPLEAELRRRWPYDVDAITVVDGALDALDRVVTELVNVGDTVVVEDPTFPPLLDMLEGAGAQIIGVGLDAEGIRLDGLAEALTHDPVALFVQPIELVRWPLWWGNTAAWSSRMITPAVPPASRSRAWANRSRRKRSTSTASRSRMAPICGSPRWVDRPQ